MEDQELGFKFIPLSASWAVLAKPIPPHLAVSISSFNPATTVVSNSQGERTRLIKELGAISIKDFNSAYQELHAMSATEKRKYKATTSRGNGRIEGEGEYSVAVQYADAIGSVFTEPLKDVELLFSLSSQPPYFALSERTEEREDNFAHPQRAEGIENKTWVQKCRLLYILSCLLLLHV